MALESDSVLVLALRVVLAVVLLVAAIGKVRDRAGTASAVRDVGGPAFLASVVPVGLPVLEAVLALLLVPAATARAAAAGVALLLVGLSVFLAVGARSGRLTECHCFGRWSSTSPGKALARNGFLVLLSGVVLVVGPGAALTVVGPAGWWVLAGGVVLLGQWWALWALFRQNGRLVHRVRALEDNAWGGAQAEALRTGPASLGVAIGSHAQGTASPRVGQVAPGFLLRDTEGGWQSLDGLLAGGRPVALVFANPGCDSCAEVPDLVAAARARGDTEVALLARAGQGLSRYAPALVVEDADVAASFGITHVPAAVLVDPAGRIAAGPVTGPDAVAALLAGRALQVVS